MAPATRWAAESVTKPSTCELQVGLGPGLGVFGRGVFVAVGAGWLLLDAPDVYLYGTLIQSAPYLQDDARTQTWAALYAAAHPERVKRLVLMCAISPRSDAPYDDPEDVARKEGERIDPDGAKRLREMQQSGFATSDPEAYCREFQRVIVPRQMGRPEALARMRSDPCAFPNEWRHNIAKHTRTHVPPDSRHWDWRQRVSSVQAPALVIHGSKDLIPLESSREWAVVLPHARLLIIPGSGHFPHLEAPDVYFSAVERFLSGEWPEGATVV